MLLRPLIFVTLLASTLAAADDYAFPSVAAEAGLPGAGPLRRYEGLMKRWPEMRAKWAAEVAANQGAVVFLGDSITQGWGLTLPQRFSGMKSANRGIGGDTTRGMLIRLDDVFALKPAGIVILAGTNDIEIGLDPAIAAENMSLILKEIKKHDPEIPIVLCQVFPSSPEKSRPKEKIQTLNTLYAGLVRGDKQVTLLDTWTLFAGPDGEADPQWFKDLLHLNPMGYDRWAAALKPVLATLGFVELDPVVNDPVQSPTEEGYVSLFNGRDLTGWGFRPTEPRKAPKNPKPDAPLFVEITAPENFDGKTASSDGRYEAINGRLVVKTPTEGRRIQQIWTQEEFDGDFILKLEFRATPNADSGVFIRKPQLQCRDYPLAGPYKDLKNYKPQDWNELLVEVKGGKARATSNGEVLEEALEVPATGPIGLEGDRGQMEYRHIRLKRLP